MGGGPWGRAWALKALEARLPTVLDADALHPEVAEAYRKAGVPAVLTPHAGEAGRLLGISPEEVAKDPLGAARALAERTGLAVVLKGNPTVVAEGERLSVNPTGNPALATGGTGDVLSGAIAALLAAGLRPFDAARLGVFLHGLAGDLLAEEKGVGLLAREVAEALPGQGGSSRREGCPRPSSRGSLVYSGGVLPGAMDLPRLYVPATLANLGSGFDALGVALDLYTRVEAHPAPEDAFLYEGKAMWRVQTT